MEKSQVIEEAEKCSTSESSWTKYLMSPMNSSQEEEVTGGVDVQDRLRGDDEDEEEDEDDYDNDENGDDENDDDSLISDASSGMRHRDREGRSKDGKRINEEAEEGDAGGGGNESSGECSGYDYKMVARGDGTKVDGRRGGGYGWEESSSSSSYYHLMKRR